MFRLLLRCLTWTSEKRESLTSSKIERQQRDLEGRSYLLFFSSPFKRCFSDNNIIECKQKNCQSFVYFMDISLKMYSTGDGKDKFNMCEINSSRSCGQIFSHTRFLCVDFLALFCQWFSHNIFPLLLMSHRRLFFQVCDQHVMWGYILMSTNVKKLSLMSKWSREARIESDLSALLSTNGRNITYMSRTQHRYGTHKKLLLIYDKSST